MNDATPADPQMSGTRRPAPGVRQLVLYRDAHPAARAARGDVRNLFVLPAGRRRGGFHRAARRAAARPGAVAEADRGDLCRAAAAGVARAGRGGARLRAPQGGFPGRDRRHGNGCGAGYPRAGLGDARSLLRSRRQRGRAPVGAGVRHWANRTASSSRIISAARCNSPTSCATSTRTPEIGRLYLPREELRKAGIVTTDPQAVLSSPGLRRSARRWPRGRFRISARPTRSWRAIRAARCERRASWRRSTAPCCKAWWPAAGSAPRTRVSIGPLRLSWIAVQYAII